MASKHAPHRVFDAYDVAERAKGERLPSQSPCLRCNPIDDGVPRWLRSHGPTLTIQKKVPSETNTDEYSPFDIQMAPDIPLCTPGHAEARRGIEAGPAVPVD